MTVTLRDIGQRLNLSPSTVSLALRGKSAGKRSLAPETVKKVRRVAREMGYRPNVTARNLRYRKTHTIGVLQGGFHGSFDDPRLDGINEVLNPGYSSMVAIHKYDGHLERMHLNSFINSRLDGVIASPTGDKESVELLRELVQVYRIPLVCLDRGIEGLDVPVVATDAIAFSYAATKALLELGHKKILFASQVGPEETTRKNREGYRSSMREAGLEGNIQIMKLEQVGHVTSNAVECGAAAKHIIDEWQKRMCDYTAILAAFDELAYFVLDECDLRGITVPEDLSIMGLGDWVSSSLCRINLSSVAEDLDMMGQKAARLMLKMVAGEEFSALECLYPGHVRLRGTTKAP